jgi:hypothetical protein
MSKRKNQEAGREGGRKASRKGSVYKKIKTSYFECSFLSFTQVPLGKSHDNTQN